MSAAQELEQISWLIQEQELLKLEKLILFALEVEKEPLVQNGTEAGLEPLVASFECLVVLVELVTPQELHQTQLKLWIEQKLLALELERLNQEARAPLQLARTIKKPLWQELTEAPM